MEKNKIETKPKSEKGKKIVNILVAAAGIVLAVLIGKKTK